MVSSTLRLVLQTRRSVVSLSATVTTRRAWLGSNSRFFSSNESVKLKDVATTTTHETTGQPSSPSSSSSSSTSSQKKVRHTTLKDELKKIPPMNVHVAIVRLRERTWAAFDETVEIAVNLGVDPRKPNQAIKGVARLPHGTGKKVRVCVFASGADAQAALDAGADVVGAEDLVERIQKGDMPFDTVIATPEMMPLVGKIGKILGPKGLMPNPKLGSVTKDVGRAIKAAKAGAVQFRVEKTGIIQAGIGKMSFKKEDILDNLRSFMVAVSDAKPDGLKGKYIVSVSLSSTMGPGIPLEAANVDPSNAKFMLDPSKIGIL